MGPQSLWEPNCVIDGVTPGTEADVLPEFEEGVRLWNWVRVRAGAFLGSGTICGDMVHIGPNVTVGRGCRIGNGAQLHEPAVVGDRVFIGPQAFLGNDRTPMVGKTWMAQPVVVGDDVVIGAGARIMGGVTIGAGAVVGMAAVVLRDVAEGMIVCGLPGKSIRRRRMHYPGTAVEHWAPVGEEDGCPLCKMFGVEQPPWEPSEVIEDAGQG